MHDHSHTHAHLHDNASPEEALALLQYLLGHNRQHAQELDSLASHIDNPAAHTLLHEAVDALEQSNDRLEAALRLLKEG